MNETRTDKSLRSEFGKRLHNWQCKRLIPIEDLSYVILNLLKIKFVVEIDGHKYDLSFGKNNETGEVCYGWSSYPSPDLRSWEIIEKAFRNGKWYEVTDEDLTKEEIESILKPIKEREEKEAEEFIKECIERIKSKNS